MQPRCRSCLTVDAVSYAAIGVCVSNQCAAQAHVLGVVLRLSIAAAAAAYSSVEPPLTGSSICALGHGFLPYVYAACPPARVP
jgi:hypothetical protein